MSDRIPNAVAIAERTAGIEPSKAEELASRKYAVIHEGRIHARTKTKEAGEQFLEDMLHIKGALIVPWDEVNPTLRQKFLDDIGISS